MPTEADIKYLQNNPETAREFDAFWGAGSSSKYVTAKPTPVEPVATEKDKEPRGFLADTALQVVGGVRDAIGEGLDTFEAVNEDLSRRTNVGGITFGKYADNGIIDYKSYEEFAEQNIPVLGQGQIDSQGDLKAKYNKAMPEVPDADTMVGAFVRPVAQFFTGYATGGKLLKGAGALQGVNTGTRITRGMVAGAIGDTIAFDAHTERLSDLIQSNEALENPVSEYLASDITDSYAEGKFKMALEGLMLGGAVETVFLGFRRWRGLKEAVDNGDDAKFKEVDKAETKAINESLDKIKKPKGKKEQKLEKDQQTRQNLENEQPKTKKDAEEIRQYFDEGFEQDFKNLDEKIEAWRKGAINPKTNEAYKLGEVLNETFASGQWARNSTDGSIIVLNKVFEKLSRTFKDTNKALTNEEALALAVKLGRDPDEVLISLSRMAEEIKNAEVKVLAGQMTELSLAQSLPAVARRVKMGTASVDDFDKVYFLLQTLSDSVDTVVSKGSRILNVRKTALEGNDALNPDQILKWVQANKDYNWRPTKEAKNVLIDKVSKIGVEDPSKLMKFLKAVGRLSGISKGSAFINGLNEAFVNAILSNPKTHAINMTSNFIQALATPTEMIVGGLLKADGVSVREGVDTYAGLFKYYKDSFAYMKMSLKEGKNYIDDVTKVDMDYKEAIGGTAGTVIRTPSRFLGAEDEFFKQINYRAKLYAYAVQQARIKLKNGTLKSSEAMAEEVERIFKEGFDENGRGINSYALDYAQTNTFTKSLDDKIKYYDTDVNKMVTENRSTAGAYVQGFVNKHPIMRQFVPFIRTPVNIMREVWKRTPLVNLAQREFREKLFRGNQSERANAMGQMAIGSTLYVTAGFLAMNGKITGGGSKDYKVRQQHLDAGWKPYSFKVGGKYIPFERLDPWGMFFGMVADFNEIRLDLSDEEADNLGFMMMLTTMEQSGLLDGKVTSEMAEEQYAPQSENALYTITTQGMGAVVKNLTSKTYLKGLTDILEALNGENPNAVQAVLKSKASGFVPNILKNLVRDPYYRETRTVLDGFLAGIPYFKEGLEPKYDASGRKRERTGSYLAGLLNPVAFGEDGNDIVRNEFARLDSPFSTLKTTLGKNGNINLLDYKNTEDYVMNNGHVIEAGSTSHYAINQVLENGRFQDDDGTFRTLNEALENLITSDEYQSMSDGLEMSDDVTFAGSKETEVRDTYLKYREFATKEILYSRQFTNEEGGELRTAKRLNEQMDSYNKTESMTADEYLGL